MTDPREALQNVSPGDRLTVHLADGSEHPGEVSDVERYHAELPGERDHVSVTFSADPGVGHWMNVYLDREEPVHLIRPMFADEAAEQGHVPEDSVSDPDERVDVDRGEVSDVELVPDVKTDGGSEPPTDEDLMDLSPGERVTLELESGGSVSGDVRDSEKLDYPNRIGNGQVKVGLELDPEDAEGIFRSTTVCMTAYHSDRNDTRRSNRATVQSYRYREEPDRVDVVGMNRENGDVSDGEVA